MKFFNFSSKTFEFRFFFWRCESFFSFITVKTKEKYMSITNVLEEILSNLCSLWTEYKIVTTFLPWDGGPRANIYANIVKCLYILWRAGDSNRIFIFKRSEIKEKQYFPSGFSPLFSYPYSKLWAFSHFMMVWPWMVRREKRRTSK